MAQYFYTHLKTYISILIFLSLYVNTIGQTYVPGSHVVVNDAISPAQATPVDSRSQFYDGVNFRYRDYQSTTEANSYLNLSTYRAGHFPVFIHSGGSLSFGVWTGGISLVYFYKDGIADGNLVRWYTDSVIVRVAQDSMWRLNDSILAFTINGGPVRTALLRGTAAGGITSLSLSTPSPFNSPVNFTNLSGTWTGGLTYSNQSANTFLAGPVTGSPAIPTMRVLNLTDMPIGIPNGNLANPSISLTVDNTGTSPGFSAGSVNLGGTITLHQPYASATVSGPITNSDWILFHNAATGALVTSVNGQQGAVVTLNADSIFGYPVDVTNYRNGWGLVWDTVHAKLIFTPPPAIGIISLNGLTNNTQLFATGFSGTSPNISSSGSTHTFNNPIASGTDTGIVTPVQFNTWNGKLSALNLPYRQIYYGNPSNIAASNGNFTFDTTTNTLNVGNFTSSSNGIITVGGSGTGTGLINGGGGSLQIDGGPTIINTTAGGITFKTINTTRFAILPTGEWQIGGVSGISGQVPTSAGAGNPIVWGTPSGGFVNPMTTNGDMIYQTGGTYGRLAVAAHAGMKLTSGASGAINWVDSTAGGGGTPGGSNTQVQFNNSGAFGGSANLTWNGTTLGTTGFSASASVNLTGTASGATTDSLLTINPSTGKVTWRSGAPFNLNAAQGLYAINSTTFGLGGNPFTLPDTIKTAGFPFLITGLPNKTPVSTDSLMLRDATGKVYVTANPPDTGTVVTSGLTKTTSGTGPTNILSPDTSILATIYRALRFNSFSDTLYKFIYAIPSPTGTGVNGTPIKWVPLAGSGHAFSPDLDSCMFVSSSGHLQIGFPTAQDVSFATIQTDETNYPFKTSIIGNFDNYDIQAWVQQSGIGVNLVGSGAGGVWSTQNSGLVTYTLTIDTSTQGIVSFDLTDASNLYLVGSLANSVNVTYSGSNGYTLNRLWTGLTRNFKYQLLDASGHPVLGSPTASDRLTITCPASVYQTIDQRQFLSATNIYFFSGFPNYWFGGIIRTYPDSLKIIRPPNFQATAGGSAGTVNVVWSPVANAGNFYELDRSTNPNFSSGVTVLVNFTNVTSYNDTGLTTGTIYYYRLRASRVVNQYSGWELRQVTAP